jgi:hypothetical protein
MIAAVAGRQRVVGHTCIDRFTSNNHFLHQMISDVEYLENKGE